MYIGAHRDSIGELDSESLGAVVKAALDAAVTLHGVRGAAPVLDDDGNLTDQIVVYLSHWSKWHRIRSAEVVAQRIDDAIYPTARAEILDVHSPFFWSKNRYVLLQLTDEA